VSSDVATDLDRLRVRFATFREHALEERSTQAEAFRAIPTSEHVLLETCHRVELVSVDDHRPPPPARGRDAVRRVFEVVAGFDSAVVAEEQLIGQVRGAYESALADGSSGAILNELFRRALRLGRRVRAHALPGSDRSLADRGAAWLADRIGPESARVVVAGTGEMARLAARSLAERGHRLTVVSRSADRGGWLLEQLPDGDHRLVVGALQGTTLLNSVAVVLAVRVRQPILTSDVVGASRPWTLDLSAPAAVSREAAELLDDRLLSIDRLGSLAEGSSVLRPDVERRLRRELESEVDRFVEWLETRRAGDAVAVLHRGADAVRRRHLDRLRRRGGLAPEQLAAVDAASAAMFGELLHGPTTQLRHGRADADTVRRIFGIATDP
jgi:glutamyl-tRNA reductase